MREPTLFELLKHGVHFGHQTSRWHPRMKQYIFTARENIHIINLEKTLEQLKKAQQFLHDVAKSGGAILIIGTKRQAKAIVAQTAQSCGALSLTERWLGGLFTNFATVGKVIERLRKLTEDRQAGRLSKYTKKERFGFDEEIAKLEKLVGGVRELRGLPQAIVVVDIKAEKTAVREAKKVGIPIVAMVDTNADPEGIAYPIPANDDATKSIEFIMRLLGEAIQEGHQARAEEVARGVQSKAKETQPSVGQSTVVSVVPLPVADKPKAEEITPDLPQPTPGL